MCFGISDCPASTSSRENHSFKVAPVFGAENLTNLEEDVNADVAEEAIPSFPSDTYSAGQKQMDERKNFQRNA